ncbi:2-phosphoxylose phosphatase 1 [Venturia canescens]|uniref:2-phosphoxylose phosphatase 1 n=1 Tax=Venturia canescens TaxID=32260 RepID=UPI001C9CA863|nr:2-phosphoxylose phosphatase 1 [Venturia canescens]
MFLPVKYNSTNILASNAVKMLAEMTRLSYHHRAISCYAVLSIWIFLLVAGMYKYIGDEETNSMPGKPLGSVLPIREFPRQMKRDVRNQRVFKFCHSPEDIPVGSEGKIEGNVTLEGVIVVTRHGDRGPMTHVRNISAVNCAGDLSAYPELENLHQTYQSFVQNVTLHSRAAWSQFLGPFHNFPILPEATKDCKLGQLTSLGVGQMLKVGSLLRNAYHEKLHLGNGTISATDVTACSTATRRTLQSGVSFLYAFLENENLQNLPRFTVRESQSYVFCNTDCACPAADNYGQEHARELNDLLESHPAVMDLMKQVSQIVFEMPDQSKSLNLNYLKDALLTYICHDGKLPCIDTETGRTCVKAEDVTALFTYIEWEQRQIMNSHNLRKFAILRSYGMLKTIVSHMLQMVSESKPKVSIFSAHDATLEYLGFGLGIVSERIMWPPYASRLVIEVYKTNPKNKDRLARDFYYRVLLNGYDLTKTISFCRNANSYTANYLDTNENGETTKRETILCPIEAIIRQLHDDYFLPFNATNFKDACAIH